jgi:hypothetical protein
VTNWISDRSVAADGAPITNHEACAGAFPYLLRGNRAAEPGPARRHYIYIPRSGAGDSGGYRTPLPTTKPAPGHKTFLVSCAVWQSSGRRRHHIDIYPLCPRSGAAFSTEADLAAIEHYYEPRSLRRGIRYDAALGSRVARMPTAVTTTGGR